MASNGRLPATLLALLWQGFLSSYGPATTVLSLILGLLAWFISRDSSVPLVWLVCVGLASAILATTLFQAAMLAYRSTGRRLPSVRMASLPPAPYAGVAAILLLERSDLFALDAIVSIYQVRDQDYEVFVGVGRVLTIQENGLVQVGIIASELEVGIIERLVANDVTILRTLVVKPTIPRHVLEREWANG